MERKNRLEKQDAERVDSESRYGRELYLDTQSSSESKSPHILCCSQPRPLKLPFAFPKVNNLDFQAFNIVANNTVEF